MTPTPDPGRPVTAGEITRQYLGFLESENKSLRDALRRKERRENIFIAIGLGGYGIAGIQQLVRFLGWF